MAMAREPRIQSRRAGAEPNGSCASIKAQGGEPVIPKGEDWETAMSSNEVRGAGLIVIGDEILAGQVQDTATQYLANWLDEHGCELRAVEIVPDNGDRVADALLRARARYDLVFTTGGLGVTHDDVTVDAVAAALGRKVVVHDGLLRLITAHYRDRLDESTKRLARVPEGSTLVKNWRTIVPGFNIDDRIYLLPGVPQLVKDILAGLEDTFGSPRARHLARIGLWSEEGRFSAGLQKVQDDFPDVRIGSYPFWRGHSAGCNIVIKARTAEDAQAAARAVHRMLEAHGIEAVAGGIEIENPRLESK